MTTTSTPYSFASGSRIESPFAHNATDRMLEGLNGSISRREKTAWPSRYMPREQGARSPDQAAAGTSQTIPCVNSCSPTPLAARPPASFAVRFGRSGHALRSPRLRQCFGQGNRARLSCHRSFHTATDASERPNHFRIQKDLFFGFQHFPSIIDSPAVSQPGAFISATRVAMKAWP